MVSRFLVYKVLVVLNIVGSLAVLATNVAVFPETVYRPKRISEAPVVAILADTAVIEDMVVVHVGVNIVRYTVPEVGVPVKLPIRG